MEQQKEEKMSKTIDTKINEGRSYRDMKNFEVRSVSEGESDAKIAEGYATTFDEAYELGQWDDWDGYRVILKEKIARSAFDETDMNDVIMQYNHEGRVFARTSNNTLTLTVDNHGLRVSADLGGTEIGRNLYEEIKGGYTNRMSFGFTVSSDERVEAKDNENKIRTITRTITGIKKLYDVSAVSIPANDGTEISARSWCDGVIAELTEEHRKAEDRAKQKQKIKLLMEV